MRDGVLIEAALAFSAFALLAMPGQMLAITLGPGSVDLPPLQSQPCPGPCPYW